jgi:hypothetical protein
MNVAIVMIAGAAINATLAMKRRRLNIGFPP